MVSKTQPAIPPPPIHLETIYEESGSSLTSSVVDIHHQSRNHQKLSIYNSNQTTHGLISARSIPSVDVHRRRRTSEYQQKPPIEVRYRDGSKRYIQPLLPTTPMIMNRRKYSHSSRHDSSSSIKNNIKYRQIFNITPKKKKKLPEQSKIILTIITAEDLSQAGITPPSTSSPDESETLTLTKSQSNSSLDTLKTVKDISLKDTVAVPIERLSLATVPSNVSSTAPVIDISVSNLLFPPPPYQKDSQHQHQQQKLRHPLEIDTIRSHSLPPTQNHFPSSSSSSSSSTQQKSTSNQVPPVNALPPTSKKTFPSLQITVTGDENEKGSSSKRSLQNNTSTNSSKTNIETMDSDYKQSLRPHATILGTSGSRSAFRPFHKSTAFNSQTGIVSNLNSRSQISKHQMLQNLSQLQPQQTQSQHLVLSSQTYSQQYPQKLSSDPMRFALQSSSFLSDRRSMSSDPPPKQTVSSFLSNQILSDKIMSLTSQMNTSNHPQQNIINFIDNSLNQTIISKEQSPDGQVHMVTVDPNLQWHSVTSKSLYDVPRLSKKYSDIPLRITIPEGTPTHNQKLLHKHDVALEKRLLDAGLSPETIALYERILEVADIRQMGRIPPSEIIDQYHNKSLLSVVKY
ncbi:unnamed protein product [Adineta steineri]|uniref:Uncharacterized protein n=1 Tax=Adineta steineri TaxID=433720 RepID=A0A815DJK1_9BILA|nr:unnamed protein product [Adineta steineri]CAF1299136.1 unnamed protein product [Adineta steineri]